MKKKFSSRTLLRSASKQDLELPCSRGDKALFGKSTQEMKAHWKVPDSRPLADFAPTIILNAKDFAAEITIHNSRQHGLSCAQSISREHVTNNEAVRKTLLQRGIRPESLPAAEDVKKVQRRLASEEKKSLKNVDGLES
jgi:DNA-damage-inducible protein D